MVWVGDADTKQSLGKAIWTKVAFNANGKLVLPLSGAIVSDKLAYLLIKCTSQNHRRNNNPYDFDRAGDL